MKTKRVHIPGKIRSKQSYSLNYSPIKTRSLTALKSQQTSPYILRRGTTNADTAGVNRGYFGTKLTRPLMVEREWGKREVDGTEKVDTAKAIFLTTAEASMATL